jgi:hypothetical protein
MTEEQEKAIDRLKIHTEFAGISNGCCIANTKDVKTILSMLEEQDKIIDLMVNNIATSDNNLCEYLDITNKCQYYAGENKKLCDDCIKQYFENEAKELINK